MSDSIAQDLSRKLQQQLGDVLVREANIAQQACSLTEISLMLVAAAVMMARTAAGTIGNSIEDDAAVEQVINDTTDVIVRQIRVSQPSVVTEVLAERARRAA